MLNKQLGQAEAKLKDADENSRGSQALVTRIKQRNRIDIDVKHLKEFGMRNGDICDETRRKHTKQGR